MMVAVNPEILKWARKTAALELDEAARKLGFQDSKKRSAVEKLERLESGKDSPSHSQLIRMSQAYYQPPLVFHLPHPPVKDDRGEDFRTLRERNSDRKGNAYLNFLMRNTKAAQNIVRSLLEQDQAEPLSFVGSAAMPDGVEAVARDIMDKLEFDLAKFRAKRTVRDAFAYLRERIEQKGIFVLLLSDLGSYHTTISVQVFRGFAFADDLAPFVVINRQDAVSAWSFTALHEVAHLWLGKSGVSGAWGEADVERFCDEVAASILLPRSELHELLTLQHIHLDDAAAAISEFANARSISRTMVAYNLMREGGISRTLWQALRDKFRIDRMRSKEIKRETQNSQNGGPDYYKVRRHSLGNALIELARYSVHSRSLTPTKAAVVLGVAPRNVYPMLFPERA